MKRIYLISLFVLAFSTFSQVKSNELSPCSRVIKRYHECKTGAIIPKNIFGQIFLNENFAKITLEKALDLQRKIYASAYNCSSEFCKCVGMDEDDLSSTHAVFFSTQQMYTEFKKVVLSVKPTMNKTSSKYGRIMNPIDSFCSDYNVLFKNTSLFTKLQSTDCKFKSVSHLLTKLMTYADDFVHCLMSESHEFDPQHLYKPSYLLDLESGSKSEHVAASMCFGRALDMHRVCSRDGQRFFTVARLPETYKNLWAGETSVYTLADSIIERMKRKEIVRYNKNASLTTFLSKAYVQNLIDGRLSVLTGFESNHIVSLFNSAQFNITGSFVVERFYTLKLVELKSITITSKFDQSASSQHTFNRTFDLDVTVEPDTICSKLNNKLNDSLKWSNEEYELVCDCSVPNPVNASEKTWIRLISIQKWLSEKQSIKIIDYKWNIFVDFDNNELSLLTTSSMTRQASGPLVNGFILD